MSTPFQRDYHPPFPCLMVEVQSDEARLGPQPALLDTGADATLIPMKLLEQINAAESAWGILRTYFGDSRRVQKYLVSLQIGESLLPGVYVIGDELGNEIILGRDVLNKLPVFLDGPRQQTEILDENSANRLRTRRAESDQ
jgi:hypothetical protein